jgi:hypothetical protein
VREAATVHHLRAERRRVGVQRERRGRLRLALAERRHARRVAARDGMRIFDRAIRDITMFVTSG